MSKPRGAVPRLPDHPRPWTVQGPIAGERMTRKSEGRPEYSNIIDRNGYYVAEMLDPDVAEMIVVSVCSHKRLVDLVRRLIPCAKFQRNAVGDFSTLNALIREAREAIEEDEDAK